MKAAVTGATGFVGGALIDHLLEEKIEVAALARDPDRMPARDGVTVVRGDLEDEPALAAMTAGADFLIHLAGVTFPRRDDAYKRVNVEGAARVAQIAAAAGTKLIHTSSLSARKPDVSPYAQSKHESEAAVAAAAGAAPYVTLRLPAIYGPGDHATLPYFKLIKSGFALEPRTDPPARASLLFVDDAARALVSAARSDLSSGVFEVGDETPGGREWREIGALLGNIMNKKVKRLAVPRPAVAIFHNISRRLTALTGKTPDIRTGQVNEFFHPDWAARENLLSSAISWRPETPLEEGFAKTVRWYQDNALL